jgi:hypothetical protein
MKSFTDLVHPRPVLAIVVNLVILIAGFQAIRSLNVRQYPRSENATVTVTTVYVGASANWCAVSSRSRWNAPSRRRTALNICNPAARSASPPSPRG